VSELRSNRRVRTLNTESMALIGGDFLIAAGLLKA
jgi:hypothetical protein